MLSSPRGTLITRMVIFVALAEMAVLVLAGVYAYQRYDASADRFLRDKALLPGTLLRGGVLEPDAVAQAEFMANLMNLDYQDGMVVGVDGVVRYALHQELIGRHLGRIPGLDLSWFDPSLAAPVLLEAPDSPHTVLAVTPLAPGPGGLPTMQAYLRIGTDAMDQRKHQLAWVLVGAGITTVLVTCLVLVLVIRLAVLSPLRRLRRSAEAVGQGDLDAALPQFRSPELARLTAALEAMRAAATTRLALAEQRNEELRQRHAQLADAQAELAESLEKYQGLFDAAPDGICILSEGAVVSANRTFLRMFAIESASEDVQLARFFESPGDAATFLELLVERGGEIKNFEAMLVDARGWTFHAAMSAQTVTYERRTAFQVIVRDITGLKRAEELLRESEIKYRSIFENAMEGIFQSTPEGRLISANPAMARILGYDSVDELYFMVNNLSDDVYVRPADRKEMARRLVETGEVVGMEMRFRRKDGQSIWVSLAARAVRGEDDSTLFFEGSLEDVTSRKKAEDELKQYQEHLQDLVAQQTAKLSERNAELRQEVEERARAEAALRGSEARSRALLNAIPDMMFEIDAQGRILAYQGGAGGLYPVASEVVGRLVAEVSPPEMARMTLRHLNRALHGTGVEFYEESLSVAGQTRHFETRMVACGSASVLAIVRDITERKRTEQDLAELNANLERLVAERTGELAEKARELEQANQRLTELDTMKSSFLSSVSHELRTPLTSVLGFAKLIGREFERHFLPLAKPKPELAERGQRICENLAIINREGQRLTRMINDVLDLTRIEDGRMQWRDQPVNLPEMVAKAVEAMSGLLSAKPDLRVELDMSPDLPAVVADPDRVVQVLINLLNNAVKFTSQGTVRVRSWADARDVHVSVSDQGVGIPSEDLDNIFDKFFQASRTILEDKPEGTGLGLAISKQIVEHYGGAITASSQPGRGSVFRFSLPRA